MRAARLVATLAAFLLCTSAAPRQKPAADTAVQGAYRVASIQTTNSRGWPFLTASGSIDTTAVQYLQQFDDVLLAPTPWAKDVNGRPRADVPLMLREQNPKVRLWLVIDCGDFWLGQDFPVSSSDHSAYADIARTLQRTNGFLYGTDGKPWFDNYRVNLGSRSACDQLAGFYVQWLSSHLWDAVGIDNTTTSIAWTDGNSGRRLDYRRAGFRSLAAMDSARVENVRRIIDRIHAAGCYLVLRNPGSAPFAGEDYTEREGLGSLTNVEDAKKWVALPGGHFLKGECSGGPDCDVVAGWLREIVPYANGPLIITLGTGEGGINGPSIKP